MKLQKWLRNREHLWRKRLQDSVKRLALLGSGHHFRIFAIRAAKIKRVTQSANGFCHGRNLVAVIKVDRHQHIFQSSHGSVLADGIFREIF